MIVLDTHILVWALQNEDKLGKEALRLLDRQSETEGVLISSISVWEIALLVKKGRLALTNELGKWIREALDLPGVLIVPLDPSIALDSVMLPGSFHDDPADRIIIATARYHDAPLLTMDRAVLDYGATGHVRTIDAAL